MSYDELPRPEHLDAYAQELQHAYSVQDAINKVAEQFGDDLSDALHDFTLYRMEARSIDRFDSGHMIGHVGASVCVLELPPHGAVVFGLVNSDGTLETEVLSWHTNGLEAEAAANETGWWPPGWA